MTLLRWCIVGLLAAAPSAVSLVFPADESRAQGTAGTIRGTVYDSLAGRPLGRAIVQLVPLEDVGSMVGAVTSDSLGHFVFSDVPTGRYSIGFLHPVLDSLGLEPTVRAVSVPEASMVRADLSVPSAARLRRIICGAETDDVAAVVMGVVRDARSGDVLDDARVSGTWGELTFARTGMQRRTPQLATRSSRNGWFAICGVPHPGVLQLMASRNADSSAHIEVEMPASGFLRRDLYVGRARVVAASDSVASAGPDRPRSTMIVGDGVISGTVVAVQGQRVLSDATVSIVDGPQVRTNARGEWTIRNAPPGTRMLEVRAVGYYPERIAVDVHRDAQPVRSALVTFKAMLDTVKVRAKYDRYSNLKGFMERSRTGVGRFLTSDDVVRRRPIVTSDLFRTVPGLFMDAPRGIDQFVTMRSAFGGRCAPTVVLDGSVMNRLSVQEIDMFVAPREVLGIEVYSSSYVPAQFQMPMSECGSIVIWTR